MRVQGWADGRPAVDYTINAATGYPMMTGPADAAGPVNHVLPAWDLLTGALGAMNLLAAERRRRTTGEGAEILLPLSDVAFSTLGRLGHIAEVATTGADRPRSGNDLFGAFGRDFVTADGERIMLVGLTAKQWTGLLEVLDIGDAVAALARDTGADFTADEGARFVHRVRLGAIFAEAIARRTRAELGARLDGAGATWSAYRTVTQALAHEPGLSTANTLFQRVLHPSGAAYLTPGASATWPAQPRGDVPPAPHLGADTDAVLRDWLGLPQSEIARLRDRGLIAG
jgi:2-methylfumaryl-CoA isomerase